AASTTPSHACPTPRPSTPGAAWALSAGYGDDGDQSSMPLELHFRGTSTPSGGPATTAARYPASGRRLQSVQCVGARPGAPPARTRPTVSSGSTGTSNRSSDFDSPAPSALTHASFRVQQAKNASVRRSPSSERIRAASVVVK